MSVNNDNPVAVPLVFEHGVPYTLNSSGSRVSISLVDTYDDGIDAVRTWRFGERSSILTTRKNHVYSVRVRAEFQAADVQIPTTATLQSSDVCVALSWGDVVSGRRCSDSERTTFALDFGGRRVTQWTELADANLWFGTDSEGRLASIIGTCPSRPSRKITLTFSAHRNYEATSYDDMSFNLRASKPYDEKLALARYEEWLDRTEDPAPCCAYGVAVESEDGDARLHTDVEGLFAHFSYYGPPSFGPVPLPKHAARMERLEVVSLWPTKTMITLERSNESAVASINFGACGVDRWIKLSDSGPWIGVSTAGELASMIVANVSCLNSENEDTTDWRTANTPEAVEAQIAAEEHEMKESWDKVTFPVVGLAGDWPRWRAGHVESETGGWRNAVSVVLIYGTPDETGLPYLEVTTTNDPWRSAELRRNNPGERAWELVMWLSASTHPWNDESSLESEVNALLEERERREQELNQRPWHDTHIRVAGGTIKFITLAYKHGWVASGIAGDVVVDIKALNVSPSDLILERGIDLAPYVQGQRNQWQASIEERRQWARHEDHVPGWAKDARRDAERATNRFLGALMDSRLDQILDLTSERVLSSRGGRDQYRSLLSLYMATASFCGSSSGSGIWTNEDGSLVATVSTMTLAAENGDDGDENQSLVTLSWSKDPGVEEPIWWGLGEDELKARVETWLAESNGNKNELPLALFFASEGGSLKVVNDIIDTFQTRLGSPASVVQPR